MITKIKIDKKTNLPEILYRISNSEFSKEVKYIGAEEPRIELIDAFRNMDRHLIKVLPFLEGLEDTITVTGLSITYDDDDYGELMGMVITAQLAIEGLNAPMNINTPFITFSNYALKKDIENCAGTHFSGLCEADLKRIFELAESYMNGDIRAVQLKIA